MRITITVDTDEPEDNRRVDAWFARWSERLAYVSGNLGCGCHYHMWNVDAPAEAVAELPEAVIKESDWSRSPPPGSDAG